MSSLPLPFFDGEPHDPDRRAGDPPASRSLTIRAAPGRSLDKRQRAFNRLLATVEARRAELDQCRRQLDEALVFHAAEIAPRLREECELRTEALRALRPFLHDRRIRGADRRLLADVVVRQLDSLFGQTYVEDPDLQELFEELHGVSIADVAQSQMDQVRGEMSDFLTSMGVDVDIPELRVGMSEEDMAASAAGFMDELQRSFEDAAGQQDAPGRPKTKREQREEARARRLEDARRASLGVVFKRLARALHPDLEADPVERERKGALMQQVTAAHAANDLHTLLRLEIELLHDAADRASLTADTLEAYTEMLKQQAADLEMEQLDLLASPRYHDVVALGPFGPAGVIDGPAEAQRLDSLLEELRASVASLRALDPIDAVHAIVAVERAVLAVDLAGPPRRRRRRKPKRR